MLKLLEETPSPIAVRKESEFLAKGHIQGLHASPKRSRDRSFQKNSSTIKGFPSRVSNSIRISRFVNGFSDDNFLTVREPNSSGCGEQKEKITKLAKSELFSTEESEIQREEKERKGSRKFDQDTSNSRGTCADLSTSIVASMSSGPIPSPRATVIGMIELETFLKPLRSGEMANRESMPQKTRQKH